MQNGNCVIWFWSQCPFNVFALHTVTFNVPASALNYSFNFHGIKMKPTENVLLPICSQMLVIKTSEYDQEIPQSQTADKRMAP